MAVTVNKQETHRFVDPFAYVAWGAAVFVLLALIVSGFFKRTLISTSLTVPPENTVEIKDLQLEDSLIGALRVDVRALLATNQWVTYEIQLRDQETDQVIAAAMKQAWKESGTWYEDGESGTWQEQDVKGGLDVQATQPEKITATLSVLASGNTAGQTLDLPVEFQVSVQTGVVDTRYLWIGLIGTIGLAILSLISTSYAGRTVIRTTLADSDPSDRAELGGADTLVRVVVKVLSDETSPQKLDVHLRINNSYGEQVYADATPVNLVPFGEDTKVGRLRQFFILDPRDSYGFQVEVLPDAPVDQTTLTVQEGSRTLKKVKVVEIKPTELEV